MSQGTETCTKKLHNILKAVIKHYI